MHSAPLGVFAFGPFTLDTSAYRLLRDGVIVPVSPKIIDLLLYLVRQPSALIPKDELFRALWPDVAVTDNALTQAVSELRQALGDDPSNPTSSRRLRGEGIVSLRACRRRRRSWGRTTGNCRRAGHVCRRSASSIFRTSAVTRRSPGCLPA
ncbi:MAG TPA: winged helix-turn-helix domain-containing protein [Vicinamibacterales bacterium]|nr:winged helix-turn-helix domain-containing protein [Vicinamibacterales bacterium]